MIDSIIGVLVNDDDELNVLASPQLWALAQIITETLRRELMNDTLDGFFMGANPRLVGDVTVHGQGSRQQTIDVMVPASGQSLALNI